jgi:hypothetical protein
MIPPEVIVVPSMIFIPSAVIFARMWFKHKEKMATLAGPSEQVRDLESRLERIEHAIDAMAIEMERVGEGQRFVTKLLADGSSANPRGG